MKRRIFAQQSLAETRLNEEVSITREVVSLSDEESRGQTEFSEGAENSVKLQRTIASINWAQVR
jgi:hypothetical protein